MQLGIFAKTFVRPTLDQTLAAVCGHGLPCIQFNFASVGLPTLPENIGEPLLHQIRSRLDHHSLSVAAISGTCNLVHPRVSQRHSDLDKLKTLVRAAPRLACPVVTLCTGTLDLDDMWRAHPENRSPSAWRDLVESLDQLLPVAEACGVILGIEPEPANVVDAAPSARRLLDEMQSPSLKIVFDAANLACANNLAHQKTVLNQAINLLGADIAIAHAKDLAVDEPHQSVPAGTGALDYQLYLALLKQSGFTGPLILHGLNEADVPAAVGFLQNQLRSTRAILPTRLA